MHAMEVATDRRRWVALIVVSVGVLMIMLDTTIVNVALPSMREDLGFSETSLVWVVNAYILTFGGSLLFGGRLGDLYGYRKLFLIGIALFTGASLMCGLAATRALLVIGRSVQGFCGAIVMAVALSLTMSMFTDRARQAKALGVYASVSGAGGSIGLLLGGVLTSARGWRWVFLVNLPIGIAVFILCLCFVTDRYAPVLNRQLDVWGAVVLTASLMLAIFALVNGSEAGWFSLRTIGLSVFAVVLITAFLNIEARVQTPIMPLGLFALRNLMISTVARMLWAAGISPWFFVSALYMQVVLRYSPLQVALAFLPANLIMSIFSLGVSAKLVDRFGIRMPLGLGFLLGAIGLSLFARVPIDGNATTDVIPGMILLGLGAGMGITPLLLASTSEVEPSESGVVSGVVNTSALVGGALGLAILISISATRKNELLASGAADIVAATGGYRAAFLGGAICAAMAALIGAAFIRMPFVAASERRNTGAPVPASVRD